MKKSLSIPKEVIEQLKERQQEHQKLEGGISFSKTVSIHLEFALKTPLSEICPYLEVN